MTERHELKKGDRVRTKVVVGVVEDVHQRGVLGLRLDGDTGEYYEVHNSHVEAESGVAIEGVVMGVAGEGDSQVRRPLLVAGAVYNGAYVDNWGQSYVRSEVTDIQPLYAAPVAPQVGPITRELTDEEAERIGRVIHDASSCEAIGGSAFAHECQRLGRAAVAAIGGVPSIPVETEPLPKVTTEGGHGKLLVDGHPFTADGTADWYDDSADEQERSSRRFRAVAAWKREQERAEKAAQPDPAQLTADVRDIVYGTIAGYTSGADPDCIVALIDKGWTLTPPAAEG